MRRTRLFALAIDEEQLTILRESIEKHDIIEPILIRKSTGEIIDGERRWRAQKAAGVETIRVRVYDVDEFEADEIRLTVQLQRVDLSDREKEEALYELWQTGRYGNIAKLSRAVGIQERTAEGFIEAKNERIAADPARGEFKEASSRDMRETHKLGEIDPEARSELLKQRVKGDLSQDEMIQVAKTAVGISTPEARKQFIEERKTLKEEGEADLKEHARRRKAQTSGRAP